MSGITDKGGSMRPGRGSRGGGVANVGLTLNERILKDCHQLYTHSDDGLIEIAQNVGLSFLAPRKKIYVLLIGNHSAGKSSFINWYIEEHVQRTGVAIETQGFAFVTSGKKRESLTGNATLHLYPHFEHLRHITGVTDYLSTEISTSKQKKFSLVTFVDTPGLVDGDMKYPFDVNEAILWLGDHVDMIFVFFDPIGQALCKRTLNLVEKLNEKHAEKMRFYLAKADEAGHESDRQRVMMQIVQELCKRPGLNKTGFEMPTIYIPTITSKASRCANQIEEVCKDIERTINQTIQNTLNALEKDCKQISAVIDHKLEEDRLSHAYNFRARTRSCAYWVLSMLLPVFLALSFFSGYVKPDYVNKSFGPLPAEYFLIYIKPLESIWKLIPAQYSVHAIAGVAISTFLLFLLAKCYSSHKQTLSRKEKRRLTEHREYVENVVRRKKEGLYQEYLTQSAAETDISR